MVSERIYDLCQSVLDDADLGDEERTDRLEELLQKEPANLKGKALEDAVLGVLWQYRNATETKKSPIPVRAAPIIRSRSPAPWVQRAGTPGSNTSSPKPPNSAPAPPGFGHPALSRTRSSNQSPFSSPKPSPRLAFVAPAIPHSPRLSAYQFSDSSPNTENYGDYGSDTVDWLVNDDASSNTSFGEYSPMGLSEFIPGYAAEMSPYDMLRSILQEDKTDEELEQILEASGYDLSQAINSMMEAQGVSTATAPQPEQPTRSVLIGKSLSPSSRPVTPAGQQRSPIVCRYWLASGHCARADCRFSHEVQNHVCKYWLQGNCIAGNACLFSHDPALLMQQLNLANSENSTPQQLGPNLQLTDMDSFPVLVPTSSNPFDVSNSIDPSTLNAVLSQQSGLVHAPPGLFPNFVPSGPKFSTTSRPTSRPSSRHASRAPTPSNQPNFQDDEAFPSLGSAAASKPAKRHHGKRGGHGHGNGHYNKEAKLLPSSLADVVRMAPSPAPSDQREAMKRGLRNNKSFTSSRENSAAAMAIPAPKDIPWLDTGEGANRAYLKARAEAFKHGGLRNKFLQSAAQAWNRNDARGAKALSLRGQNENSLMREAHREAARILYEDRNQHQASSSARELYVDLHGLHPEEAVAYLTTCLQEQRGATRPVYAICGTGHHSKNGKDKVGKAVRQFLNECRYAFREFSVPGDRNNVGGILGIDPTSYDKEAVKRAGSGAGASADADDSGVSGVGGDEARKVSTKVQVVREDSRKVPVVATRDEMSDEGL